MGQYHKIVNLDKMEEVSPHTLALGAKQYEHTGCEASLSDALYLLLMTSPQRGGGDWPATSVSGRWVGDRVVVVGDYTEDSDLPFIESGASVYGSKELVDIGYEVATALSLVWRVKYEMNEHGYATSSKMTDEEYDELVALTHN